MSVTNPQRLFCVYALLCLLLALGACAPTTPARTDQMAAVRYPVGAAEPVALTVTVYGDDVGGFASHYYPLPRADFEQALIDSLRASGRFLVLQDETGSEFNLSVGLIQLIQPQWSGTVTLETAWAVYSTGSGEEIARRPMRVQQATEFSNKREATELAARETITEGMAWLYGILDTRTP
jgi:hypothetical protein